MGADHAPGRAGVREEAQLLAHLLAAADDRREALVVVGQREEDARDLLVHRRREQPERLDARLLGSEGGVAGSEPSAVCSCAVTSPSRPSRSRNRSGASSDLVERELPAVDAAARRTPAAAPSVAVSGPPEYSYQPRERRHVPEAVLGEEAQHLELRVDARARAGGRP